MKTSLTWLFKFPMCKLLNGCVNKSQHKMLYMPTKLQNINKSNV
jgi:hypothetical protein